MGKGEYARYLNQQTHAQTTARAFETTAVLPAQPNGFQFLCILFLQMLHVRNNYSILRIRHCAARQTKSDIHEQSSHQSYRLDPIYHLGHRILHRRYRQFLGDVWIRLLSRRLSGIFDSLLSEG